MWWFRLKTLSSVRNNNYHLRMDNLAFIVRLTQSPNFLIMVSMSVIHTVGPIIGERNEYVKLKAAVRSSLKHSIN